MPSVAERYPGVLAAVSMVTQDTQRRSSGTSFLAAVNDHKNLGLLTIVEGCQRRQKARRKAKVRRELMNRGVPSFVKELYIFNGYINEAVLQESSLRICDGKHTIRVLTPTDEWHGSSAGDASGK